ncbi:MAG: IMPACT family protein [Atribacterota bacterium]
MNITRQYQTISHYTQLKSIINKSRFIASVREVKNKEETKRFLKAIVQQFPDANHHCWAYRFGIGREKEFQCSDAGEPANTAGLPMLQVIKKERMTNVMVIVSRYFGGVKLGKNGLIRAYRNVTREGLLAAGKIKKYALREFVVSNLEYPEIGSVIQTIESQKGLIINIDYGEKIKIIFCLPDALREWMTGMLQNITQGKGCIRIGGLRWYQ